MRANQLMTKDVVSVKPKTSLADAYEIMMTRSVRHLPVIDGHALVGILSDRDLLLRAQLSDDGSMTFPERPVKDAMSQTPITCTPGTPVATIAKLMLDNKIDSVPVVSIHGDLIGLVTTTDLLGLLAEPPPSDE
ncbi:CBS domain-containing protein [Myxococcota bacterium]|nr:CBS domain-containing protein [Myxococcota bacterium]